MHTKNTKRKGPFGPVQPTYCYRRLNAISYKSWPLPFLDPSLADCCRSDWCGLLEEQSLTRCSTEEQEEIVYGSCPQLPGCVLER